MGNTPSARRFKPCYRMFRTSCVTSITCGKQPNRCMKRRHAKKELKKHLRGIRPIERAVEQRSDAEAQAIRGYCLAVRSALTDDGRPPLAAPGLKLYERITAIAASLTRVSEKGACRVS